MGAQILRFPEFWYFHFTQDELLKGMKMNDKITTQGILFSVAGTLHHTKIFFVRGPAGINICMQAGFCSVLKHRKNM